MPVRRVSPPPVALDDEATSSANLFYRELLGTRGSGPPPPSGGRSCPAPPQRLEVPFYWAGLVLQGEH